MKTIIYSLISFVLGAVISAIIGFKLASGMSHQAIIGKLTDNVSYYRLIQQGKPELVQNSIATSLGWFINMAEDAENSVWISNSKYDAQALAEAKKLLIPNVKLRIKNASI